MPSNDPNCGVVITGLGVVSPIGIGVEGFWDSLIAGRSGVRVREEFEGTDVPLRYYSPVTGFEGKQWVKPRKALKVMCEPIQFGYAAARMAADQAGLSEGDIDPNRFGTVFGSETFFSHPTNVADVFHGCVDQGKYEHDKWGQTAMREIEPLWMLKYLPNMVTSHVSIAVDARGPSNTICQREVSGLLALIEGQDLIQRGLCDAVVVGGTGCCTSLTVIAYHGSDLPGDAQRNTTEFCRPFELNRSGTILGEGAGAILLENEQHARNRGANILCSVAATNRNFCAPNGDGFGGALKENLAATLNDANLNPGELGHLNAHAFGSPEWDHIEANAIHDALADVPTVALKSYFGYLGAGTSIIELVGSVLSLDRGQLPATLNFEQSDPDCPCNVVDKPTELDKLTAIKLSYSIHGQIASVAISR